MDKRTKKALRRAQREHARQHDPYFGRRRRAGEVGNAKSKAAVAKKACRGRVQY